MQRIKFNGNCNLHSTNVCTAKHFLHYTLTCNLNFHSLVEQIPVVVNGTYIHSSQIWLYTFEVKNSPPYGNLDCCVTSISFHVNIIITYPSFANSRYASVVAKSPLVSKQYTSTTIAFCSAPNANCLISANPYWTSECRAILSS